MADRTGATQAPRQWRVRATLAQHGVTVTATPKIAGITIRAAAASVHAQAGHGRQGVRLPDTIVVPSPVVSAAAPGAAGGTQ